MLSKKSCFNKTLFFGQLKRFWPLYASYFVIWLLILPIPLISNLRRGDLNGWNLFENATYNIMASSLYGGLVMTAIFSALFAMAAYYYLYNSRSVSQMGSIPVKRTGVFISAYLPGLVVMLGTSLIINLLAILICSFYGVPVAGFAFQSFAMTALMTLFFYGFASFCATLTGHILVLPLVYGVLNFTIVGVAALTSSVLEKFVYGMTFGSGIATGAAPLSPVVNIFLTTRVYPVYAPTEFPSMSSVITIEGYTYNGWGYLIGIAVAGIIFTALSLLIVKRRRMEAAGDVVAINPLKPVFKYCMSFGTALVAGVGLYFIAYPGSYNNTGSGIGDAVTILIYMLLGAFLGYFAAEMLISKSFKVFAGKRWRGFAAVALILVVLTAVSEFDVFGFERKVPNANDVESAQVFGFGPTSNVKDIADIQAVIDIHQSLVAHKAQQENRDNYNYSPNFYIDYFLKDGSMLRRRYYLNTDVKEDLTAVLEFINSPSMILVRGTPEVEVSETSISDAEINSYNAERGYYDGLRLTAAEAYELYTECIVPDMHDGTIGILDFGWINDYYNDVEFINTSIYIYFFERDSHGDYVDKGSLYFQPTTKSLRTNAWLEAHGLEVSPHGEVYYQ